jgi:hypothetical protein
VRQLSFETANLLLLSGADVETAEFELEQRSLRIIVFRRSIHILDFLCGKGVSPDARTGVGDPTFV